MQVTTYRTGDTNVTCRAACAFESKKTEGTAFHGATIAAATLVFVLTTGTEAGTGPHTDSVSENAPWRVSRLDHFYINRIGTMYGDRSRRIVDHRYIGHLAVTIVIGLHLCDGNVVHNLNVSPNLTRMES